MTHPTRSPQPPIARLTLCAALICAAGSAAVAAAGDARRVLIDRGLRAITVDILAVETARVIYNDDTGRRRESAAGEVLAMLPADLPPAGDPPASTPDPGAPAAISEPGVLELTTGERYPGELASTIGAKDTINWRHRRFGRVNAPLDSVRAFAANEAGMRFLREPATRDAGRDRLLLANGDRLAGFVLGVGEQTEIKVEEQTVAVNTELVSAMRLADSAAAPARGPMAWLDDGTIARLRSLSTPAPGAVYLVIIDAQSTSYPFPSLLSVVFDTARLAPLAGVTPRQSGADGASPPLDPLVFRSPAAVAPAGAADIEFPGPMRATWTLPAGVTRFAALAELPRSAQPWGDFEMVVRVDGREALRERLHEGRPAVEINLPISGKELTVVVEPGRNGPINDRLVLRRALLLLSPTAAP